ncbi:MAG: PAS domain-containing protein [Minwuia sp.]|uniref:PAS domain-containing protein n=1 Tax=Minwuia sp. TaxID=2493630 RepID=UPI003A899F91
MQHLHEPASDGDFRNRFGGPPSDADAIIQEIHDYWLDKAGDRDVPDRRDLDPLLEIPKLTPHIWLLDVVGDPPRYRYRLLGSQLVAAGSASRIGQFLDEVKPVRDNTAVHEALRRVCAERIPYWYRGRPTLVHDGYVSGLEYIMLPLTVDGSAEIRMLMNLTRHYWSEKRPAVLRRGLARS